MYVKITRGLGGVKGLMVLILTVSVGIILVVLAGELRRRMLAPKGVAARPYKPETVLALREQARGAGKQLAYITGDFAQVVEFGPAQLLDGQWITLEEGVVLKVTTAEIMAGETWVEGLLLDRTPTQMVRMHASFLTRYLPVVLDQKVELAQVRLVKTFEDGKPFVSVACSLRNITDRTLERVLISCVFQDRDGREVDVRRSPVSELPRLAGVRFQTYPTDKPFASFALQVTYATPEGLREYLSTVVIKKSSLP
jgi:hypothetical protein